MQKLKSDHIFHLINSKAMGLNIYTEDPTAPTNEEHFLHDLAIPLTTFKLNLELLEQQYQQNPCLQRLRIGYEQIDLMLKTQRSYSFARIRKCKLTQILLDSLQLFAANFNKDSILIATLFKADIYIPKHEALLRRVIINLLKNSLEALQEEPKVHRIRISTYVSGKQICFKVYNSGRGFPEDLLIHLTKRRLSTKLTGNGLGLIYINKIITQVFKGRVELVNPQLGGAEVRIYLPL